MKHSKRACAPEDCCVHHCTLADQTAYYGNDWEWICIAHIIKKTVGEW